ncbi:aminoacyl-tRNA hydrolase [Halothermothrix orenii]|uniref:Peptidyl-tRNA hydrolase n=1 Tax=Halothermothrix orenii (strain H 168 / OCM 544 / DSM 9562) TaxID=373903 RepID=B8D014_HALOH|nr:aminoacyl-tRNA hydrolase [Halothermothrix orenii]ACL70866.1 Aminoacyl-tRNA hydrolase [Halothermothrix orenii H 168]
MYLVVGLGNPGDKYAETRHNIGFQVIERLARKHKIKAKNYPKFEALCGRGMIRGQKVMLAQPLTYMNNSGRAVRKIIDYYDFSLDNIIIIYDDLDLPPGKIRIRKKGSSGGHNGVKSIINCLDTREFPRIRIGIGRPPAGVNVVDYVLGYFSSEDSEVMSDVLDTTVEAVETILEKGLEQAMNIFNS